MAKTTSTFDPAGMNMPDFSKVYTDFNRTAAEFSKLFVNGKTPHFDVDAAVAAQRKNVEAFTAAGQVAFQGAQAVVRRQFELMREAADEFSKASKDFTTSDAPEAKFAKQAEMGKAAFESAVANMRELGGLVQRTNIEAAEVISKRVADNFDEIKSAFERKVASK